MARRTFSTLSGKSFGKSSGKLLGLGVAFVVLTSHARLASDDGDKVLKIIEDAAVAAEAKEENKNTAKSNDVKKEKANAGKAPALAASSDATADAAPGDRTGDGENVAATEDAGAAVDEDGPKPLFYFRDKSKVAGYPGIQAIEVITAFGALRVPIRELVRVRFAPRVAKEIQEQIDTLIEALGSDDFDARESASERLIEIGARVIRSLSLGYHYPIS